MRLTALVLAAALIAGPSAARPSPKAPEQAAEPAPVWKVERMASRIGFAGRLDGKPFKGHFRRWDAFVRFDPKQLDGSRVNILIDTATLSTGSKPRDEALATADWLGVVTFPRAIFSADHFRALGHGRYEALGTLAIRNVRRPVALPFTLAIRKDTATVRGGLTIDRTDFGVGQGLFPTGDTMADKVRIELSLTATRVKS